MDTPSPSFIGLIEGMPVTNDCLVSIKHPTDKVAKATKLVVHKVSNFEVCIVKHQTLFIKEEESTDKSNKLNSQKRELSSPEPKIHSRTRVVDEIIKRIIDPLIIQPPVPNHFLFKGLMLLGPPGVGKSFAVQAVQSLCQEICEVQIVGISIPELLSSDNPLNILQYHLSRARSLSKGPRANKPKVVFVLLDEVNRCFIAF